MSSNDMDCHEDNSQLRHILPAESASQSPMGVSYSDSLFGSRHAKRRAPITGVACQDCRKRKTKCDGNRPRCANCAKRGVNVCQYDAEGTQSNKIAIYKAKIDHQALRIAELESENSSLKEGLLQPRSSPTPSLPAPFLSLSINSSHTLMPSLTTASTTPLSSASSSRVVLNPIVETQDQTRNLFDSARRQDNASMDSDPISHARTEARDKGYEHEIENQVTQKRSLQYENSRLREVMVFLTVLDDRALAEKMALRIRESGLTDDLLSEVNALFAAGRTRPTQRRGLSGSAGGPSLPALSSLDLPMLSTQYAPDLDPDLHTHPAHQQLC